VVKKNNVLIKKNTLISRHPYKTHTTVKKMENLEQSHETLKTGVYSMKEQMVGMMEALNLIKSKLESSNSFTEGGVSSYLRVPHKDEV